MATKVDFKRELRQLYGASREPRLVDVPVLNYLMIDGHGDPNTAVEYRDAVEALYAISYAAKFLVKGAPDGVDYGVLPLEGLWWTADMSRFSAEDKSAWDWTMMIMQPDVVTAEIFEQALAKTAKKRRPGRPWPASVGTLRGGRLGADHARRSVRNRTADDPAAARVHRRAGFAPARQAP